jgi:hypothetical protein
LPGYIPIGIRNNHMDMTKFEHANDPGFVAVAGELRRWVKDLAAAQSAQKPGPSNPEPGTAGHFYQGMPTAG